LTPISESDEQMIWLKQLLKYAKDKTAWDTSGIWVCEAHPFLPWDGDSDLDFCCT